MTTGVPINTASIGTAWRQAKERDDGDLKADLVAVLEDLSATDPFDYIVTDEGEPGNEATEDYFNRVADIMGRYRPDARREDLLRKVPALLQDGGGVEFLVGNGTFPPPAKAGI